MIAQHESGALEVPTVSLEVRADCIASLAGPGAVRGALRQQRVREMALRQLTELARECRFCGCRQVTEEELIAQLEAQYLTRTDGA